MSLAWYCALSMLLCQYGIQVGTFENLELAATCGVVDSYSCFIAYLSLIVADSNTAR